MKATSILPKTPPAAPPPPRPVIALLRTQRKPKPPIDSKWRDVHYVLKVANKITGFDVEYADVSSDCRGDHVVITREVMVFLMSVRGGTSLPQASVAMGRSPYNHVSCLTQLRRFTDFVLRGVTDEELAEKVREMLARTEGPRLRTYWSDHDETTKENPCSQES